MSDKKITMIYEPYDLLQNEYINDVWIMYWNSSLCARLCINNSYTLCFGYGYVLYKCDQS